MFAAGSPERLRDQLPPPPYPLGNRMSESPHISQAGGVPMETSRGRGRKGKEPEPSPAPGPPPSAVMAPAPQTEKKKRKPRRPNETTPRPDAPPYGAAPPTFKVDHRPSKPSSNGSPEPISSNGSGSGSVSRSIQPSPTNSVHLPPTRVLDEDYDEGVAGLLDLSNGTRGGFAPGRNGAGPAHSPPVGSVGRTPSASQMSPHSMAKHPAMMARTSPPMGTKRPLSPGPPEHPVEMKRSRVGSINRRASSPSGGHTPSSRPSPIPFRQQPTSHSPESRQPPMDNGRSFPPSPALPTMLPPHPRPIGAGLSGHGPLPPLNTRSSGSPPEDDRMHSRSASPPRGGHGKIVLSPPTQNPGPPMNAKGTPSPSSSHGSHHSSSGRKILS